MSEYSLFASKNKTQLLIPVYKKNAYNVGWALAQQARIAVLGQGPTYIYDMSRGLSSYNKTNIEIQSLTAQFSLENLL